MKKLILISVGLLATGLAFLGVLLPGLPTTPFLLVALWAFANSSQRLHAWLVRVPFLQSALKEARRFEERRAMRASVKVFAMVMAWGSLAVILTTVGRDNLWVTGAVAAAVAAGTVFVIVTPTDSTELSD